MKKKLVIVIGFFLLIVLGWYTKILLSSADQSDSNSQLINFAIEDTNSVDKIIITDAYSNKIEIVRKKNKWETAKGGCINQESVHFILDAFGKIVFKGYLPEKSQTKFTELMSTSHTKVEIFQNGEWSKTWYIGPAAPDHYGQIMLLESEEAGKSTYPVMMSISGVNGIIEPRFFADERKWICTSIFNLEMNEIGNVDVNYPKESFRNFSISQKGRNFIVQQNNKPFSTIDTANVFRYLQNYKKIHFNIPNYELSKKQCDSLHKTTPFCILKLSEKSGRKTNLRMFRINSSISQENEFGELINQDMDRFWCELPNGEFVKCQYFVFNPLIMGHVYFPEMEKNFPAIN